MFDQNPPHTTLEKIAGKQNMLSKLDLEHVDPHRKGGQQNKKHSQTWNLCPNMKVIAEIKRIWGTKNMPPKKHLSKGTLSNDADYDLDADTNSSKTICRTPPYRGLT